MLVSCHVIQQHFWNIISDYQQMATDSWHSWRHPGAAQLDEQAGIQQDRWCSGISCHHHPVLILSRHSFLKELFSFLPWQGGKPHSLSTICTPDIGLNCLFSWGIILILILLLLLLLLLIASGVTAY